MCIRDRYLAEDYVKEAHKPYVDGVHLDYVRMPDVILPVSLWKNYGICLLYTSCQDNDKDNNPYNSTLLFIHFSLSGFFVCKYRQISVSFYF